MNMTPNQRVNTDSQAAALRLPLASRLRASRMAVIYRRVNKLPGMNMSRSTESTSDREFVHSRLINAPRERVFKAFSEPEHLARWWGPNGFTSTFHTFDLRVGGKWTFVLHGPDGTDYPNESVFVEVVAPQRVVLEHLSESHHFYLTITFESVENNTSVGWRQVFDDVEHKKRVAHIVEEANEQNLDRLEAEVRNVQ